MCSLLQISSNEPENDVRDFLSEDSANINEDEEGIIIVSFYFLMFILLSRVWLPSFVFLVKPPLLPVFREIRIVNLFLH